MSSFRRSLAYLCLLLSPLTIAAVGMSHLALTDIAHGEPNLSGEWTVLRVSALIFLALGVASSALAWQALARRRVAAAPA